MKFKLLLLFLLLSTSIGFSQNSLVEDNRIYTKVDVMPVYEEGEEAFYKYIKINYITPNVNKSIKGQIIVQFIVEKDGSLTDIKVVEDLGYGTGEEAVWVLSKSKKWIPGYKDGYPVRVRYTVPISLSIKMPN